MSPQDSGGDPPRWGRRRFGPPHRPPWWPENEAWPPQGARPWRRIGRRFLWRFGLFATAVFLFIAVALTAGVVLAGTALGVIASPLPLRIVAIALLILLGFVLLRGSRRLGRMAAQVGAVVEGASRIEAGEYGVQVAERGPRELRTLARAFNAMSDRLASTERNRRTFVADLAHELRTPLAVIRGQAEAIGDGLYPADQAHMAPILDAARSLESLVDALPTLTLSDVGSLQLNREAVEVPVLVNSVLASFQSMADAAGVTLRSDISPNLPAIDADPARVRGVLMNLLSNALRYTPTGGEVVLSARPSGDAVMIAVRDTGQGIPDDLRGRVFNRFVKGPGSPGAGLGLAIAKDVVTAHGGAIDLRSEMGKGTEIRVTLPASKR